MKLAETACHSAQLTAGHRLRSAEVRRRTQRAHCDCHVYVITHTFQLGFCCDCLDRWRSLVQPKAQKTYSLCRLSNGKIRDASSLVHNSAASLCDDAASLRDGAESLRDDAASLRDDAASFRDDAASLRDGAESLRDGVASLRDDAASLRDDAASLRDGPFTWMVLIEKNN